MLHKGRSRSQNFFSVFRVFTALFFALLPMFGQTTINLQTQTRNPDFSSMSFTRPLTVGTSVPATCQVGQLFFNSSSAPGANIFGCTATNIWSSIGGTGGSSGITQLTGDGTAGPGSGSQSLTLATVNSSVGTFGSSTTVPVITVNAKGLVTAVSTATVSGGGGGGASLATQLLDLAPTLSGATVTFGGSCSVSTPCLVYLNGARYPFTNASTLSLSGSASDTVYFYLDGTGTRTAGINSANTYTPTNVTVVSGITAFPQGAYPLYQCTVAGGAFTSCSDYRPILSKTSLANGQGTSISQSGGITSINVAEMVDFISTVYYTVPGTACGHFEIGTNGSAGTWGLPQPSAGGMMTNGCAIAFKASGGSITLQPSSASINGASTYTIASGRVCRVVSDGTNYQTEVCP